MRKVISSFLLLICIFGGVESRYCKYFSSDGYMHTILCQSYEFCCGNACCRSVSFKFYQFWYFWLSVILILLMCSGGSWWYRLRYRNQLYTPHYSTSIFGTQQRHQPGVMYYTTTDRVHLSQPPKDFTGHVVAPPSYAQANVDGVPYPAPSAANYTEPPPQYETLYHPSASLHPQNTNVEQQQRNAQGQGVNQPPDRLQYY